MKDYLKAAHSKGLREFHVILKHALKNAAMPMVTMIGLQFGLLLGGSIVCEMIFAWPGVGRLIIFAIYNRDYPLVEAAVFMMAMVFVCCNLLVDLCYAYLDPRVKVSAWREKEFMEAARAIGCHPFWVLFRHILPNILSYVLILMTIEMGRIIVLESTLSFLGLGVQPPTPSWGMALADGKEYLITGWWLATFPGLTIMMVVLCMNVLGDSVHDFLEPRTRSLGFTQSPPHPQ
jgi:ABC-type dipeptide/oligopeptide/nickel transport system permease subunit